MSFEVGSASIDVTPPVGTWMGGFGGRLHGAVSVHDPLCAKAIAVSDGSGTVLLISCDIISFSYDYVAEVCAEIGRRTGLGADQILLNTSHTHSGPLMHGVSGFGAANDVYAANLVQQLGGLAQMAVARQEPVRITSHRGPLQVGINRRERTPEGGTRIGRNPELIVDRCVDVLGCAGADGRRVALWFAHATHGVTLGGNNYAFSADWMGYGQRELERVYPGSVAAFAQGCCGNINSDPVGGTFADARRLGTRAAGGVMMALESDGLELAPPLAWGKVSAAVPQQAAPTPAAARAALADAERALAAAAAENDALKLHQARAFLDYARWQQDIAAAALPEPTMRFDISAVALGEHAIVGLAGEVFHEYAVTIAAKSPFERTTVLGTTNGCIAYLPTAAEIPWRGYEIESSMRYYLQLQLKPECEQVVLDAASRLLHSVRA